MLDFCRSQWPRGLRRRSAAAWLLGSLVRIPLRAWMFVCFLYVVWSCVGRGLCDGLITRPEESYHVSVGVWSRNPENGDQRSILDFKRLWMNEWNVRFLCSRRILSVLSFSYCFIFSTNRKNAQTRIHTYIGPRMFRLRLNKLNST
jgi:hypothetical protein